MTKKSYAPFFAFLMACAVAFCYHNSAGGNEPESGSKFTPEDFLSASGTHVVNRRGKPVLLRGFNLGGWMLKTIYMSPVKGANDDTGIGNVLKERFGQEEADRLQQIYLDNFICSSDFDTIAKTGANSVRLPFWWRNFMDENGDFILNDQGKPDFSMLDRAVAQCAARGIYVVFALHGTPGSQHGGHWSGFGTENPTFFARNAEGERNRAITLKLWRKIAEHFADDPAVAGYDILGEPYWTGTIKTDNRWWIWDFYDDAYKAIREVDPDHLLIFESSWDVKDLPLPSATSAWKDSPWKNIAYSVHYYPRQWEKCDKAKMFAGFKKRFNKDIQAQQLYKVPVYVGETNYYDKFGVWKEVLDAFETSDWSYSVWSYKCPLDVVKPWGKVPWGTIYCGPVKSADVASMSSKDIEKIWSQRSDTTMRINRPIAEVLTKRFNAVPVKKGSD